MELFTFTSALKQKELLSELTIHIQLLESPIPAPPAPAPAPSQKASSDDILGTKRGTIDPLVSKRQEKILNTKIRKNIATGETSQAITSFHFFDYCKYFGLHHFITQ